MESGRTNKGAFVEHGHSYLGTSVPTNYYLALVVRQLIDSIDNAAAVDKGGGLVGIPVTGHSFTAGMNLGILGTTNYNNHYIVQSQTPNEIVIKATYAAENFAGTEEIWKAPGPDTNTVSDLTEIAAGNGYTSGGYQLSPGATDFDAHTESDADDWAFTQIKDVVWTATGGPIPASGAGARYAVLIDDNVVVADRQVLAFFYLVSDRTVSDTQPLTIQNCEMRATNPDE